MSKTLLGSEPKKGGILAALRRSPMVGTDLNLQRSAYRGAGSTCEPESLMAWMAGQNDEDLFISSLTVAEIRRVVLQKPAGKKRVELERWFFGPDGPQFLFAGRVLSFDEKAGLVWARLMAEGSARGRPRSPLDMIVAAVAEANDCVLVTDNERQFAGIKTVNPLRALK